LAKRVLPERSLADEAHSVFPRVHRYQLYGVVWQWLHGLIVKARAKALRKNWEQLTEPRGIGVWPSVAAALISPQAALDARRVAHGSSEYRSEFNADSHMRTGGFWIGTDHEPDIAAAIAV
jgi:hypothetical protein